MLSDAKRRVVGIKQVQKQVEMGMVTMAYVASDAQSRVVEPLINLCLQKGVSLDRQKSMKELGTLFGIQVGAAAAAELRQ